MNCKKYLIPGYKHVRFYISIHEATRRGSIYNGNTLITPPTKALEFYAICGTKDLGLTFLMVY